MLVYASILKMEATCSPKRRLTFNGLLGVMPPCGGGLEYLLPLQVVEGDEKEPRAYW
jgi:hypothetical protein